MTPEQHEAAHYGELYEAAARIKQLEDDASEMADTLLRVAIYFRLEAWERDMTDEETAIYARIESALDNSFGRVARQAMRDAITRDTERALATMEAIK